MKTEKATLSHTELNDLQLDRIVGGVNINPANRRRDGRKGFHTKNPANGRLDSNR